MKYCMKCGTLLEDSHEICIGCGADMSEPGAWSMYPPEMAKNIEKEKEEKKSRTGLIVLMVIVFALLVAAIALFIIFNVSKQAVDEATSKEQVEQALAEANSATQQAAEEEKEKKAEEAEVLKTPEIPEAEEATSTTSSSREIKDAEGRYYNFGSLSDSAGNTAFTTIYPEDFSEITASINYGVYSTRYPECITYIVGNEDGNVRLTYMSPQHYWYRKSDGRQTRSNERDIYDFMQFYTYNGAQGFIESLIKESYTDIKGFKFIGKDEYSPDVTGKIEDVSKAQTIFLTGDIGDYGKIADDTVYAAMAAECEAYIYHYEATSRQNNTIYMDFYVPVISNTLEYVTESEFDKGEITEWLVPQFVAFEAGNEELYNLYSDSFKLFIANSKPTEEFLYINRAFSDEIEAEIASGADMSKNTLKLDSKKLEELHGKYKKDADLGEYGNGVKELLKLTPSQLSEFNSEEESGPSVIGLENSSVAFYDQAKGKVFISPAADEFPGDEYMELKKK